MNKDPKQIQTLIDNFDDIIEEKEILSPEDKTSVISVISTRKELEDGLGLILDKVRDYKEKIDSCDQNIKNWQSSKKMWAGRTKALMDTMSALMQKLNIPNSGLKVDGIKLSTSTRTVLEVDEQWLVAQYEALAEGLQQQLPDYVKVSLSVDKNKLFAHVKEDSTMLVQNPDKIHTNTSSSTTIK